MEAKKLKVLMERVGVPVADKMSSERMLKRLLRHVEQNEEVRKKMTQEERVELLGEATLATSAALEESSKEEKSTEAAPNDEGPNKEGKPVETETPSQKPGVQRAPSRPWLRAEKRGILQEFRRLLQDKSWSRKDIIEHLTVEFGCHRGVVMNYISSEKKAGRVTESEGLLSTVR